ncbi:MAG TPA: HAD family phosphatase [Propionibacterium sp.]|nr:HAD family phosphatase [Propionibacterium sp.]
MRADLVPGVDVPAALLWDFDGTLVDSEKSWHAAEARLMDEWGGGTMTPEQHHELVGNSLRDSALAIMAWTGRTDEDPDHWAGRLNDYALEDMTVVGVDFRPGAREFLGAARAAGIRCALVSASYTAVLDHIVGTMPAGSFEVVVGGDQVSRGKPDAEPYLLAAEKLGLAVRDCLALEDSIPGTTSAENAGMATLGIPFEQEIGPATRRRIVPTLVGLTLAEAGAHWRDLRDA